MSSQLAVVGLGRTGYAEALAIQRAIAHARIDGTVSRDVLLLVEHPPVVTIGRSAKNEHGSTPREFLKAQGVELYEVERGGDVTYHGPGQLVGYTIYDLNEHKQDLHWFLRQIEESIIVAVSAFGITGGRREGYTGVWVQDRKLASIGIHIKQWVSWHGFALNVATDLSYFDMIVPCGIANVEMTSVRKELGARAPTDVWGRTLDQIVSGFSTVFQQAPQVLTLDDLGVSPLVKD